MLRGHAQARHHCRRLNEIQIPAAAHTDQVKENIQKALQHNAEPAALSISVRTEGGKVVLTGEVRAWYSAS
jgi:osmotically-inducible protein OsmY